MCFYIYAPNKQIEIKYSSEYIELFENGCSDVITDLLIINNSQEEIKELFIIYPNKFYDIKVEKEEPSVAEVNSGENINLSYKGYAVLTGTFEDITSTLITRNNDYNWVYTLEGSNINVREKGGDQEIPDIKYTIPEWATYVEIVQTDPLDLSQNVKYDGILGGSSQITIVNEGIQPLEALIFNEIHFTIFKCSFSEPIAPNVPRWLRYKFHGQHAAFNINLIRNYLFRKWTNQLYFEYQVFGPYNVRDRFINYLLSYKRKCEGDNTCSINLTNSVKNLVDRFTSEGIIGKNTATKTVIKNLFLHVNPGRLERLTDPNQNGDIIISGSLPNLINSGSRYFRVYEWKAIAMPEKPEFKFSLLFQAKPTRLLYYILPWVALTISITGLFIALVKLIRG